MEIILKDQVYPVTLIGGGTKFRTEVRGTTLESPSLAALKKKVQGHLEKLNKEGEFVPVKLITWSESVSSGFHSGRIQHVTAPKVVEIVGFEIRKKRGRGGGFEQVYFVKDAHGKPQETTYMNGTYHPYSADLMEQFEARTRNMNEELRERYEQTRETQIKMPIQTYIEKVQKESHSERPD